MAETEQLKIRQVLESYLTEGLINHNIDYILSLVTDHVIGFGTGEQGFVNGKDDVKRVLEQGKREDNDISYHIEIDTLHINFLSPLSAFLCARVVIRSIQKGIDVESVLLQSLALTKTDESWKICGVHASLELISEESIAAYPLLMAQESLNNLRAQISEKVYQREEQYRRAIMTDAVAFYLINFTHDYFEKCDVNVPYCLWTTPGTPYNTYIKTKTFQIVSPQYANHFVSLFSLENIMKTVAAGGNSRSERAHV